jgi:hypothetical protein
MLTAARSNRIHSYDRYARQAATFAETSAAIRRQDEADQAAEAARPAIAVHYLAKPGDSLSYRFCVLSETEVRIERHWGGRRPAYGHTMTTREYARKVWAKLVKEGYDRF